MLVYSDMIQVYGTLSIGGNEVLPVGRRYDCGYEGIKIYTTYFCS